jgi:hypothetical protein
MLDSRIVNMGLGQGHQVAAALFRSFCGSGSTRSKALTWFPRDRSPLPDSAKSCRVYVFVRVFEEHVLCRHVSEMQRESQQLLFSVTCSLISFSSSPALAHLATPTPTMFLRSQRQRPCKARQADLRFRLCTYKPRGRPMLFRSSRPALRAHHLVDGF